MAAGKWTEGLSKTSIGRFGGMRDDMIPFNEGYLTAAADERRIWLQLDYDNTVDLGTVLLPHDACIRTQRSWTGCTYTVTTAEGEPHSVITRSLLFPGFHHQVRNGVFEFYWRIKDFGATEAVLPLKSGLTCRRGTQGYDRARDGDLAKPWVFFHFATCGMPFDYPLLFAFDKHPERIEVWTHEYVKIFFRSKTATVTMIHPFGAQRLDKKQTASWIANFPRDLVDKFDFWAAAALAYPYACKESFRIDEKRSRVHLRCEFRYHASKSEWGVNPIPLAPLPPVTTNARHAGYPVEIKGRLFEKLCPTFHGWYEAVKGTSVEYSIPLSRFRDHALAPVAIRNNKAADAITGRLREYLKSGDYLTFGGDDHYDPETSIDSLHDLRIMAWALWSIPEEERAQALAHLTRGVDRFGKGDFLHFTAPVTGTEWMRHATIFDYLGVIDYDMEWYNGMHMAGLWAWDYFAPGGEALKFCRERWNGVKKVFAYYQAFTDWDLGAAWTSCRGEGCWLDGVNYSYEGLLGYAALARKLGKKTDAQWGDYLAAKTEAFLYQSWNGVDYPREIFGSEEPRPFVIAGYHEDRPSRLHEGTGWSCGVFSYAVRETFMLMKDFHKERELDEAMRVFGTNFPEWRRDPYAYGKGKGYPGKDQRRTIHHYFLDPRLMVCALVLGEDPDSLLHTEAPLTGSVLECILAAMAPKLLVPREAQFLGSTWDDGAKTLTVRLKGKGRMSVALLHSGEPKSVAPALQPRREEGRVFYDLTLDGETEIVFQY